MASILSLAMMCRYSLGLAPEAQVLEGIVSKILAEGYRTPDIMSEGKKMLGTSEMGDLVVKYITDCK